MKYSYIFYRVHMIDGEGVGYFNCSSLYVDNVKFSYIINMHVMLFIAL